MDEEEFDTQILLLVPQEAQCLAQKVTFNHHGLSW